MNDGRFEEVTLGEWRGVLCFGHGLRGQLPQEMIDPRVVGHVGLVQRLGLYHIREKFAIVRRVVCVCVVCVCVCRGAYEGLVARRVDGEALGTRALDQRLKRRLSRERVVPQQRWRHESQVNTRHTRHTHTRTRHTHDTLDGE